MIKRFLKYHPIHKKLVPSLDIVFLLRPTLFFSVWVMVVIGMSSAQMNLINHPLWITELSWATFFVFTGVTIVCSSTFILNQISDVESDTINKKLFLVGQFISPGKSQSIAKILLTVGLVISIIANWFTMILVVCIYLVWGILYNQKPFKWKKKPILGWFANSIAGVLLFMIGWYLVMVNQLDVQFRILDISMFESMFPYILCFSAVSLLTTLPDMKGDVESGDKTFPIVYGNIPAMILSLILICSSFVFSLHNQDPIASTATLVSIPFFVMMVFRRMHKDVLRAIRYPIFIINFFALSVYPWLFVPLIITYYLSKYYYWHRFELHYPTLLVDYD